jgi:hypothetical protein
VLLSASVMTATSHVCIETLIGGTTPSKEIRLKVIVPFGFWLELNGNPVI